MFLFNKMFENGSEQSLTHDSFFQLSDLPRNFVYSARHLAGQRRVLLNADELTSKRRDVIQERLHGDIIFRDSCYQCFIFHEFSVDGFICVWKKHELKSNDSKIDKYFWVKFQKESNFQRCRMNLKFISVNPKKSTNTLLNESLLFSVSIISAF